MTDVATCEFCKAPASPSLSIHWHGGLHAALCRRCHAKPSTMFVGVRREQIRRGQVRRLVLRAIA